MFFTAEKIAKQLPEIRQAIHREALPIPSFKFFEGQCDDARCPFFDDRDWRDFNVGEYWGGYDIVAWFRATVPIPAHFRDHKVALRFLVGPRDTGNSTAETLLFVNGAPLQAIDVWHDEAWLPPELLQAEQIQIALKAWSGVMSVPDRRRFRLAQLVRIDEPTERFYYLADTLLKAVNVLDENDLRRIRLLRALNGAFLTIDFTKPHSDAFYASIAAAERVLRGQVEHLAATSEIKPTVVGIGHSHLDLAWLWRLCHTREKAARTFATVLHLMRQYPEYYYLHASPQLFKFVKEDYPEIYAQIKERVAAGQWEMTGGMWVEADINLPSGESLVRQILYGKRFFRDEFGVDTRVLWLPDVFGYSWTLPQIMKQSGLDYFMTTKISWNQFNRFPYDTFHWRGIDGSEVLTHFVTTPEEHSHHYTYIGTLEPREVKGIWDNYKQKDINDTLLHVFGWGDGGGGPTKEMIEMGRTMRNLPGLPRVELAKAEPYFAELEARIAGQDVPVWDGELYLEYHRGTYTSQAHIKRANRKAEVLYHDAEWLSAVADVLTGQGLYPAETLREGWERLLLNQFHDILPGSSIRQVYEDSRADFAQINELGGDVLRRARAAIVERIGVAQESVVVFNSLSWTRAGLIELPWSEQWRHLTALLPDGTQATTQIVDEHGLKKVLLEVTDVPALGYQTLPLVPREHHAESADAITIAPERLENRFYRVALNERGQIVSLFDKQNEREVLPPRARGNVLQVFEDKPMNFDAWDIDPYFYEKMREIDQLIAVEVVEQGPLRGVLELQWRFYDSLITQRITLYGHSPRIDFRTEVDWRERQVLLKVAFPVAVRATKATYDIQFGSIERPTHSNTSWDYARFESVAHKWVDLSEGGYGVGLLNDCKYGYDVKHNVLRLTLIKSPIGPDETADRGRHVFTYSLLPHAGTWSQSAIVREGYDLNYPLLLETIAQPQPGKLPHTYAFAELDADNVVVETIKRAEDEDAWIVRVYECQQFQRNRVSLSFGQPIRRAVVCNLLEEDQEPARHDDRAITFGIVPYEIKTFKVWLA
ncbi:MAG TPA: alpha-mannosidase [Herpetosiphonaceae bacterium]